MPNVIVDNYNIIINEKNGKNFYGQPANSDIKRCEEIIKLTTGQGEDYTTGYLFDYKYIKIKFKLITVDLRRQKESKNTSANRAMNKMITIKLLLVNLCLFEQFYKKSKKQG